MQIGKVVSLAWLASWAVCGVAGDTHRASQRMEKSVGNACQGGWSKGSINYKVCRDFVPGRGAKKLAADGSPDEHYTAEAAAEWCIRVPSCAGFSFKDVNSAQGQMRMFEMYSTDRGGHWPTTTMASRPQWVTYIALRTADPKRNTQHSAPLHPSKAKTLYAALGLANKRSSIKQIKSAYKLLALKYAVHHHRSAHAARTGQRARMGCRQAPVPAPPPAAPRHPPAFRDPLISVSPGRPQVPPR